MTSQNGKGIAVAGTILVEKDLNLQSDMISKLSCVGSLPDITLMLKKLAPQMKVSAIGKVFEDERGRYAVHHIRSAGVETSGVKLSAESSEKFGMADMVFRDLSCKILHLGYFAGLPKIDEGDGRKILQHARRCGIETSVSMRSGSMERYAAVLSALPHTDYFTVSLENAGKLTDIEPISENLETIARKLLWHGVKKKVFIYSPQWLASCSRIQYSLLGNYVLPQNAVCGETQVQDAFCAGVLVGLHNGWDDMKILEFASSCAAAKQCRAAEAVSALDIQQYCKSFKRYKKVL